MKAAHVDYFTKRDEPFGRFLFFECDEETLKWLLEGEITNAKNKFGGFMSYQTLGYYGSSISLESYSVTASEIIGLRVSLVREVYEGEEVQPELVIT